MPDRFTSSSTLAVLRPWRARSGVAAAASGPFGDSVRSDSRLSRQSAKTGLGSRPEYDRRRGEENLRLAEFPFQNFDLGQMDFFRESVAARQST